MDPFPTSMAGLEDVRELADSPTQEKSEQKQEQRQKRLETFDKLAESIKKRLEPKDKRLDLDDEELEPDYERLKSADAPLKTCQQLTPHFEQLKQQYYEPSDQLKRTTGGKTHNYSVRFNPRRYTEHFENVTDFMSYEQFHKLPVRRKAVMLEKLKVSHDDAKSKMDSVLDRFMDVLQSRDECSQTGSGRGISRLANPKPRSSTFLSIENFNTLDKERKDALLQRLDELSELTKREYAIAMDNVKVMLEWARMQPQEHMFSTMVHSRSTQAPPKTSKKLVHFKLFKSSTRI